MSQGQEKDKLISKICDLAFGKSSDIINLVCLEAEGKKLPRNLDLRMVSEIKKNSNGSIEIKLLNRIELLRVLMHMFDASAAASEGGGEAASFFSAMDKAAARLKDDEA